MPRTFCALLAVFALAACGGGTKHPTRAPHKTAAPAATRTATRGKTQRKPAARPDSAQRNPLMNR